MPDRLLPARARRRVQIMRVILYAVMTLAALAALVWPPEIIPGPVSPALTWGWAVPMSSGSLVALVGVAVGRYRIEWPAVCVAAGGISACALLTWNAVAVGGTNLASIAAGITALAVVTWLRAVELSAHAARLRAEHEEA